MEIQEVELAVQISGDYAAWHEISLSIMYDYTNDVEVDDSKEEADEALAEGHDGDYSDCQMMSGILYKGRYYINL